MPVESMNVTSERSITTPLVPSSASPSSRLPSFGAVCASISPRSERTCMLSPTGSSTSPKSIMRAQAITRCGARVKPAAGKSRAVGRHRGARPAHPGRQRPRDGRLVAPSPARVSRRAVVAHAPAAQLPPTERQPDPVPARAVAAGARIRPLATAAVIPAGAVVVVAQPEEPDQPDDQEPDVEHPEADHEDPPLRGHATMLARPAGREKAPFWG